MIERARIQLLSFCSKNLLEFMASANKKGYALGNEYSEEMLEDGSKRIVHAEGKFKMVDRWKGSNPFFGQTVYFADESPLVRLNYSGYSQLSDKPDTLGITVEDAYSFLKKALMNASDDIPLRGPPRFQEGNMEYLMSIAINSDACYLAGHELIRTISERQAIYEGLFHFSKHESSIF
jgi:hypothetical protein